MIEDKVNTGVTSGKNNPNHVNMDVYYAKLPDYQASFETSNQTKQQTFLMLNDNNYDPSQISSPTV